MKGYTAGLFETGSRAGSSSSEDPFFVGFLSWRTVKRAVEREGE